MGGEPVRVGNELSGHVGGTVVQAGSMESATFHVLNLYAGAHAPHPDTARRPRQLPPRVPEFVNREHALAELSRVWERRTAEGRLMVAVLRGLGGVGKSALGRQWAHAVGDRFPGGHLYADLGRYRHDGGVAVSDVLGDFLRALGLPEHQIPPSETGRVACFRTLTADAPVLVLLDDADSEAQVRPLLPNSAGSAVVVTSRRQLPALTLDGAVDVLVDPLDAEAAGELVARLVGAHQAVGEPDVAARLLELCGGLPQALRTIGGQLQRRPGWTMERLVGWLDHEEHRWERLGLTEERPGRGGRSVVEAVWDAAYRELSPEAARAYRLLAGHPGDDLGVPTAAALLDRPVDDAEQVLEELCEVHLLTAGPLDRFRFHRLVREHALWWARQDHPAEERTAAVRRVLHWYRAQAAAADAAVLGRRMRLAPEPEGVPGTAGFAGSREALAWFETERRNLVAAVREADARGWDDLVWWLCEALWAFFLERKHYADWFDTHRLAVAAAVRCGDRRAEARMRCQLARALMEREDFPAAHTELREALVAAQLSGDLRLQASVVEFTGRVYFDQGDLAAAQALFVRSLAMNEAVGNRRGVMLQLHFLGRTLDRSGRSADAVQVLRHVAALADGLADRRTATRVAVSLAEAYGRLGQWEEATASLTTALTLARERAAWIEEAQAVEAMADVALARGDETEARRLLRRAADVYDAAEMPWGTRLRSALDATEPPHPDPGATPVPPAAQRPAPPTP